MSHKISVDFTGLCVFATSRKPESVSVLMTSAAMQGHMHKPILTFNARNYGLFTGGLLHDVIQVPDGSQYASWNLDQRIVRFETGKDTLQTSIDINRGADPPSGAMPLDLRDEMDLRWLPSLARLTGQEDVDPVYYSNNPVSESGTSAISARVDLDRGFLFANAAVNRLLPLERWNLKKTDGTVFQQYLADTVRLEIDRTSDERLVILGSPFKGSDMSEERLELVPKDGRIQLTITNFPMVPFQDINQPQIMNHFAAYYDLLKPIPANKWVPRTDAGYGAGVTAPPPKGSSLGTTTSPTRHTGHGAEATISGVYPSKCMPGIVP